MTFIYKGICPVCNKTLTIGVLNRVEVLCDRKSGTQPQHILPYYSRIPLKEILSEILNVGTNSQKVMKCYRHALHVLGSELYILDTVDISEIDSAGYPILKEAIERMRKGHIHIIPGFDGKFGKIQIFSESERMQFRNNM